MILLTLGLIQFYCAFLFTVDGHQLYATPERNKVEQYMCFENKIYIYTETAPTHLQLQALPLIVHQISYQLQLYSRLAMPDKMKCNQCKYYKTGTFL